MKLLVLGDSLEVLIDHRGKTPKKLGSDFVPSGVPVASALLVSDGILKLDEARYVSEQTAAKWMPVPTRKGDVLLTSEAPLGRVARVPIDEPLVLGQRLFGLRGKAGILDSGYLYYALQTASVQAELTGRATGTTVVGIRQSALREVRIPAPEFKFQVAIAEVLGALDDKIAANRRLLQTAEDLAISMLAKAPTTPLGDIVSHRRVTQLPSESGVRLVAHYSLPAFDATGSPEFVDPIEIKSNKFRIETPSVLISKLNPRFPRVWEVPEISDTPAFSSTEFLVLEPRFGATSTLWAALRQIEVGRQLESMVAGTSGSHQRVKPAEVLAVKVADPRMLETARVQRVESLTAVMHAARRESAELVTMRDMLLPRLMSGELRVRDAEDVVSQAV